MKFKKALLTILAIVLICAISITGTLAYLKANTGEVKNTFIAAGGGSLFEDEDNNPATGGLTLNESKAEQNATTGVYTLKTTEKVTSNTYNVVPGSTIPKDPRVSVTEKNDVPAYLYVEIVNNTNGIISFTVDNTKWIKVDDATAPHGGTVYVWNAQLVDDLTATSIISGNKVSVKNVGENETLSFGETNSVSFYAYLAQSVVGEYSTAKDVFNECFKAASN